MEWSKSEVDERVAGYSNEALVEETIGLAMGDDYDGCFTERGWYEYEVLTKELNKRLKEAGFIQRDVFGSE